MKLELSPKQTTAMTPQLIQAIEILQMNSQELMEYVSEALQENAVLEAERTEQGDGPVEFGEFSRSAAFGSGSGETGAADSDRVPEYASAGGESLFESLRFQLRSEKIPGKLRSAAMLLAESLNDDGWLDESLEDIACSSGFDTETLEMALERLQSLEPAGVGARDLAECLSLQLKRYHPEETLALEIAREQLSAMSKGQYGRIAAALGSEKDEVHRACRLIRSLTPRPGSEFSGSAAPEYVIPDVIVSQSEQRFEVRLNQRFSPALSISGYYSALAETAEDTEVRAYLAEKLRQAKWLISTIEQRRKTLCRCVACLLRIQEEFFLSGSGKLVPMSLSDIAAELEVHESTVSRALKGKYLQCPRGTFPMSYFFSRSFATMDGTNSMSPDMVKALIREMIGSEDKKKPLSDQKICDRLNEKGCAISRRTVAKYRDELRLPGASGRKAPESR